MSTYRRATLLDLAKLGYVPNTQKYKEHIEFARKYYPPEATTMVIVVHSEYNDCTYNNSFQYIIVYDMDGDEYEHLSITREDVLNY